ncbi:7TM diverse intracellular signaling domain-containing protein [Flammeovirga agarivorans]|uniref:SpoIIE family protein phosphatase n=1 Tax=Flammeovirga agarivorans TaxID=2726742 RepID=A0A7X8SM11_9BACT|nr:7TM diverse intracellular signaling domain-containing protein [Flammeovirga agarivorans]NLR92700.1 SpoIIE family protein phosphatase [Flammeovirga agarivorans]
MLQIIHSNVLMTASDETEPFALENDLDSFQPYDYGDVTSEVENYWIKFDVQNLKDSVYSGQLSYSYFDHLILYKQVDQHTFTKVAEGGILYPNIKKNFLYRGYTFLPIDLKPKEKATYYLRCSQFDRPFFEFQALPQDLTIIETSEVKKQIDYLNSFIYLFLGAMILMILYNMGLYFMVKDKGYIYYSMHVLSVALFNFTISGKVINYLETAEHYQQLNHWLGFSSAALFILFSQTLLNIKENYPRLFLVSNLTLVGLMILNILVIFELYFIITPLGTVMINLTYLPMIYIANKERKRSITARYFFYGVLINFIFITLHTLEVFELIPPLFGIRSVPTLLIGACIEQVIFSLSLGAKINDTQLKLHQLIIEQNQMLEREVSIRTKDLEETKEELEIQNETLSGMNKQLASQNDQILSSINYAKRIQEASLPNIDKLEEEIGDTCLLYMPRDTVSGDFYWYKKVGERIIIIIADCTGHGVPGALMSILGIQKIEFIVNELSETDPHKILERLDIEVKYALNQQSTNLTDGMDAAVCVIDKKEEKILFSGAKNPMIYFKNDQLKRIKGSRNSIGGEMNFIHDPFSTSEVCYKDSDVQIYMFSDGYQDQFGVNGKKYMSKHFRTLLSTIFNLPLKRQEERLKEEFNTWTGRGTVNQVDDVLVFGALLKTNANMN